MFEFKGQQLLFEQLLIDRFSIIKFVKKIYLFDLLLISLKIFILNLKK